MPEQPVFTGILNNFHAKGKNISGQLYRNIFTFKVFMMKRDQDQQDAIQRFWDVYRSCVEENRVRSELVGYYVKWDKAFIDFLPGKRLRERSRKDLMLFLTQLGEHAQVKDWQVKQAEHALKLFYEVFLPGYHPDGGDVGQIGIKNGQKRVFRDRAVPGEIERRFAHLVAHIRTEIRCRHYTIRTESAYINMDGASADINLTGMIY
jgi:hypothetical protein